MVTQALLTAYRETDYWCAGFQTLAPFSLRVDTHQPALQSLYQLFRVDCAAFITACNPLSQAVTDEENRLRQERLRMELASSGYATLPAEGRPLKPGWHPEASWLVPGLSLQSARQLGQRYQQHAIVWAGADCIAQLQVLTGYNPGEST